MNICVICGIRVVLVDLITIVYSKLRGAPDNKADRICFSCYFKHEAIIKSDWPKA